VADGSSAEDRAFTRDQIASFDEVLAALRSVASSPASCTPPTAPARSGYPEARRGMVRVGLALYGYLPEAWLASALEETGERLVPALTLRANVVAVRRVEAGERPSYRRRRATQSAATIATSPSVTPTAIPADCSTPAPKSLSTASATPWRGLVTMDMLVIDCGDDVVRPATSGPARSPRR